MLCMKKIMNQLFLLLGALAILGTTVPGCKSKPKDADLEKSVETALQANPQTAGLAVDVTDGVATISGEVTDAAAQSTAASLASGVKGVKSVTNNVTVAAPVPP